MSAEYGADQIQILEGLEAVRKRPGMYIGSTSSRGLHHLVYEIVDNSVDEALAGYCDHIQVFINPDNSITVIDNGRGIPVGINHKAGLPAVEVVFTVLHAGGKFGGGGYKVSGGLHGVGASVVNALSDWLEVEICHEGKVYRQRYEKGHVVYKLKVVDECDPEKTGTKVTFLPDETIFEDTVFDYDTLKQRLRETAFLTKGLRIVLTDLRENPARTHDFHYAGGVKQVMKQLAGKIHTDAPTIYGDTTWGELLDSVKSAPNKVIHSLEDPVAKEPGLKIMRGNISPAGAIVRPTAVYEEVKYIKGAAKVYECDQDAYRAIMAGEIVAGDILVIRYEGCKGAPGMKELMLSIDALIGLGLDKKVGLITDARFSGFNYGAIVGHVSPEAYDGGVIALIENGDEIEMDIAGGTVNLLVSDEILAERRKSWVRPPLKQQKGVLNIYAQNCRPAEEGGAMQPWALDADYGYHHE